MNVQNPNSIQIQFILVSSFLLHCGIIEHKVDKEFYNNTNIIETISEKKGKLWMSLGPSKNGHVIFPIQEVWHLLSRNDQLLLSKPPSIRIMVQIVQIEVALNVSYISLAPYVQCNRVKLMSIWLIFAVCFWRCDICMFMFVFSRLSTMYAPDPLAANMKE